MAKIRELAVILVLIGFLAYLPSLFGGFVWDDEDFVYRNTYVKETQITRFFTENAIAGAGKASDYYRPVQFTLYALLYRAFGAAPLPFHLAAILLHLGAAVAVFYFLREITGNTRVSFAASLLFLVHPVATESVSYVSGLSDPLYALFFFLSCILFLRRSRNSFYFPASLALFFLALLSKELALILPGILFLAVLLRERKSFAQAVRDTLPFFITALLYLGARLSFLKFQDIAAVWHGSVYGEHFTARLATFFHNFFTYVQIILFPADLFMERDFTTPVLASLGNTWTVLFLLTVAGTAAPLLLLRRKTKNNAPLFFFLAFLASLLPYTGVFLLNGIFYEHYVYLPMVFFWGLAASVAAPLLKRRSAIYVLAVVACLFMVRSYMRQWDWIDAERFYRQTLSHAPQSVRILNGLGMTLGEKGDCREAIGLYEKAIKIDPRIPNPYHNIANCWATLGNWRKSEEYYLKAVSVSPRFYYSYLSLLQLYLKTGETEKAKAVIKDKLEPMFPDNRELQQAYLELEKGVPPGGK